MWTQVGERIGKLRRDSNLSRAQFGRMIGLSEQYIGKIERGITGVSGATIAKICDTTGVSADYILFGVVSPAAAAAALSGLSHEQITIGLDLLKRLALLICTENGNNALIQEICLQQDACVRADEVCSSPH